MNSQLISPVDLTNKSYLMVGGGGYLTLPACQLLAQMGATVIIADRSMEILDSAHQSVCGKVPGARVSTQLVEISEEKSIDKLVDETLAVHKRLDGMVNAAAASSAKRLEDLEVEDFEKANRVNQIGFYLLARKVADAMHSGGSIVMISSMYGCVAPDPRMYPPSMIPNPLEYGVSKAGILQMVRYMAAHYGSRGIRFNAIAPGPFPKPWKYSDQEDFTQSLAEKTMLGRVGRQDEIAGSMFFLLSELSSYMTGQCITVDGGWTAW